MNYCEILLLLSTIFYKWLATTAELFPPNVLHSFKTLARSQPRRFGGTKRPPITVEKKAAPPTRNQPLLDPGFYWEDWRDVHFRNVIVPGRDKSLSPFKSATKTKTRRPWFPHKAQRGPAMILKSEEILGRRADFTVRLRVRDRCSLFQEEDLLPRLYNASFLSLRASCSGLPPPLRSSINHRRPHIVSYFIDLYLFRASQVIFSHLFLSRF